MGIIIQANNLSKSFGHTKVVDDVSFSVEKGKLFAFLGQNGAGKSTTINMLIGILQNDTGTIVYEGNKTYEQYKNNIGVVFQNNIFDDMLTVEENMKLFGRLYSHAKDKIESRYEELAKLFSFNEFEKKKFRNLSGGQKRRMEIARALFCSPEILFLDEPTTGLDPRTRVEVWNLLSKIRKETGMTIFLTTHYMEETADADEVMIIHKGKIIANGSPAELKDKYSKDKIRIVPNNKKEFEKKLREKSIEFSKVADYFEILSKNVKEEISILNTFKADIKFFEVLRGSMDDVFLNAIGENITEGMQ